MERRHLEYFLAVAECGSISAAARQLGVSQPTVSEALTKVESEHGVPLLRRLPRGVALTDAGRNLVGPAAQVLRGYAEVDRALDPALRLQRGRLTLVCPRTLAQDPMAAFIGQYRREHPGIVVTLQRPQDGESAAAVVASGRAEIGLGVTDRHSAGLHSELLTRQGIVAIVHPDVDLGPSPRIDELVSRGLITTPPGGVTRRLLSERVGRQVVDDSVVVETSSTGSMVPLVRAGLGVAFVPEALGRDAVSVGLQTRSPRPDLTRDVFIVASHSLSPPARAFLTIMRRIRDAGDLQAAP